MASFGADIPRISSNFPRLVDDGCSGCTIIVSTYDIRQKYTDPSLSRLQRAPTPDPRFGFFVIGRPLACICHLGAITVCGIGAFKTWKTQNAMVRGKALSGGFEIIFVGVGVLLVSPNDPPFLYHLQAIFTDWSMMQILITMFVLLTAIDIKKTHF